MGDDNEITQHPAAETPPRPHYHAIKATEKWKAFMDGIASHATRTATQRAEWDAERKERTSYERAAEAQKGT